MSGRMPAWAAVLHRTAQRAIGGGDGRADRGGVRLNVVIDIHKAGTGPFILLLMQAYDAFTPAAWVYLALHGTYGIAWVLKDVTVGDRKWRTRVGLGGVLGTWAFLSLYWVAPVMLVLGSARALELGSYWSPPAAGALATAVVAYVVGLVLMIGADVQKNATLAARRPARSSGADDDGRADARGEGPAPSPGLITTGFYARMRHPNYLGEMLIYGSFAMVVNHWIPWVILAAVWGLFFLPNMLAIEASLSRYPGYEAWRERTGFLLPRIGGQAGFRFSRPPGSPRAH